jgi:hypothetical protein
MIEDFGHFFAVQRLLKALIATAQNVPLGRCLEIFPNIPL